MSRVKLPIHLHSQVKEIAMNRLAIAPQRNTARTHSIAAKLDLENADQRQLHDFIQRMHTGRWPMLRCLDMRQIDGQIVEAAEWLRSQTPTFAVIWWRCDGLGMSWREAQSAVQARAMLNAV
jgi:hypothetical protein